MTKPSFQPKDFLKNNQNAIETVFPGFFHEQERETQSIDTESQLRQLEHKAFTLAQQDPLAPNITEEQFLKLDQLSRLTIVKDILDLGVAISEAEKAIEK